MSGTVSRRCAPGHGAWIFTSGTINATEVCFGRFRLQIKQLRGRGGQAGGNGGFWRKGGQRAIDDLKGLREDLEGSININRVSSFVSASKAAHAF